MSASRPTLVVAARSARMLAEAAAREGYEVVALDAFGDADTRRAAAHWQSIAAAPDGTAPRVDARRLLDALATAKAQAAPMGWIAGSDLECMPGLLEAGAAILPLIGNPSAAVRSVRDPAMFFAALDALDLPCPETKLDAPGDARGWLRKDARACGGWHIRHAAPGDAEETRPEIYFQREAPGRAMSALFVAGLSPRAEPQADAPFGLSLSQPQARQHRLVGFNELIVRPYGAHPHVYRGAIGPVALPRSAQHTLVDAIDALIARFGLRGLCSLDFLWHDGAWSLLEINPRPSASMALYAELPLVGWQLEACGFGVASATPSHAVAAMRGIETVFARRAFTLGRPDADRLQARDDCHDVPASGIHFEPGDPVCSVSAVGNNPADVHTALAAKRRALRERFAA
jgi:predicted ATP-grasp superfamily ATP-dependent carboligase